MLHLLKLSHHRHSGRLRPHEHTSYVPLIVLLLVVGFILTIYTTSAQSPPPESGSIGLTGIVPAKPPTEAATITSPTSQSRFSTTPVTISGSCPKNTLVEIFKNEIFAGSSPCADDENYTIEIDLLIGQNEIIARVYDALNQPGPDSNAIILFYDALPPQAGPTNSLDFGGPQLLLNTDAVFRGTFPEETLSMPIEIIGGTPPYAVNIQWGDANNKVISRNDNTVFNATHIYKKAGTYKVSIQASDALGRVAFLSVASIVNGQPPVAAAGISEPTVNRLLMLWPLYTASVAVVVSFWLGEWREKRVLGVRKITS